jgi:hypothetical protein
VFQFLLLRGFMGRKAILSQIAGPGKRLFSDIHS